MNTATTTTIPLAKGEKLLTFINKINGITYYSTNRYKPIFHEGQEMLPVFQRAAPPNARHLLLVVKSALERKLPALKEPQDGRRRATPPRAMGSPRASYKRS